MDSAIKNFSAEPSERGKSLIPANNSFTGLAKQDYLSSNLDFSEENTSFADYFRQYLFIMIKRKWIIISITIIFVAFGGVRALMKTPLYSSTAKIQIDREAGKIMEGISISPREEGGSDFLRTQYALLKSRAMAERVVAALRLYEDDSFLKPRDSSGLRLSFSRKKNQAPSAEQREALAVQILMANISINPLLQSRLVDLVYLDPSPVRAQRVANAYADAYVASTVDKRFQANSYAKAFLEDQIKQLQIRLEDSEKALLQFAEREKIIEVTEKSSIAENNLAAANTALGVLISERIKNEQLWQQLEKASAISLPQLLSNRVIDTLRGQRKDLETEYQEKLESFKPDYPVMVQIANKIKEIDRQIASEIGTIRSSLKAAYESSVSEEKEMMKHIEALREEVLALQKKGIQYNVLKREVETNRGLYNSLLQRYKEVDIAGGIGTSNVFVVERGIVPAFPSEPDVLRHILAALSIGLALGIICAIVLEKLDDRVRAPEEMEKISGLSTLGIIPHAGDGEPGAELSDPRSAMAEAYRSFATALQFSTESGLPRSVCVTSTGPGEGKSTTVLALARHFAQMGLKVLLIDADLRKPSLHTKQGLDNAIGFSNFLIGASLPPEVIQKTDHPNLAFMASGPLPPNAADLLSGTRLYSMISLGAEVFDLILLDAPPLLGLADAPLIANATAATIFVVGAGQQRKGMIRAALRRLQLSRVTVLGSVITKFEARSVGYAYSYSYHYKYSYGHHHDEDPTEFDATDQGKLSKIAAS